MFENATTLHLRAGKIEIVLYLLRSEIVPILKRQPGLIHLGLIPAPNREHISVVSVWASKEAACAIENQCIYLKAVSRLDPFLAPEPNSTSRVFNPLVSLSREIALN